MPVYEFRCNACGRKVALRYASIAEYSAATPACPRCQSTDLTRLISRIAIKRSSLSRLFSGDADDDAAFDDLENADPATLGRMLREMGDEVGEDMGPEFDEVVTRLERGESPEDIEATMPDLADDMGGMGGGFGGDDFGGASPGSADFGSLGE